MKVRDSMMTSSVGLACGVKPAGAGRLDGIISGVDRPSDAHSEAGRPEGVLSRADRLRDIHSRAVGLWGELLGGQTLIPHPKNIFLGSFFFLRNQNIHFSRSLNSV